jgi:hypothetical protein
MNEVYAQVYVMTSWFMPANTVDAETAASEALLKFREQWDEFFAYHESNDTRFIETKIDVLTQLPRRLFQRTKWVRSGSFQDDVRQFFNRRVAKPAARPE